jgi:hypothetical protein
MTKVVNYNESSIDESLLASVKQNSKKIRRIDSDTITNYRQYEKPESNIRQNKLKKSVSLRNLFNNDEQKQAKLLSVFLKNNNAIRLYDSVPTKSMAVMHIVNQDEVKKKFLESKIPPVLKFKGDQAAIQNMMVKYNKPNFHHFFKAKYILDLVKAKFPNGLWSYYQANFGERISTKECMSAVGRYLSQNNISGEISVNFAPGLTCSGRIISFFVEKNKPETRRYDIWINDEINNQFLRKNGIISLCDHEIGTHYFRSYNDGKYLIVLVVHLCV